MRQALWGIFVLAACSGGGDSRNSADTADKKTTITPSLAVTSPDVSVDEDATVTVDFEITAENVVGQPKIVIDAQPQNGSLTLEGDSQAVYVPDADFNGPDSIQVHAEAGEIKSETVTVTITVSPVNDLPVAYSAAATATEDGGPVSIQLTGEDIDGDALTFTVVAPPAKGLAAIDAAGVVTYTPGADENGVDIFTVRAGDGQGYSDPATVYVDIAAVFDEPVFYHGAFTIPANATYTGVLPLGGDWQEAGLTFSIVHDSIEHGVGAGEFSLDASTAAFTLTPPGGFEGVIHFVYGAVGGAYDEVRSVTVQVGNCADKDGDGYGTGCLLGADCDDTEATIHPNAPELPADGIVQRCGGADLAVTDSTGIFVSTATGNDTNDGTQAAPVATIQKGLALAGTSKVVFVAQGTYADEGQLNLETSIFGGFEPSSWTRDIESFATIITDTTSANYVAQTYRHDLAIQGFHIRGARAGSTYVVSLNGRTTFVNNTVDAYSDSYAVGIHSLTGRIVAEDSVIRAHTSGTGQTIGMFLEFPATGFHFLRAGVVRNCTIGAQAGFYNVAVTQWGGHLVLDGNIIQTLDSPYFVGVMLSAYPSAVLATNNLFRGDATSLNSFVENGESFAFLSNNTILAEGGPTTAYSGAIDYGIGSLANNIFRGAGDVIYTNPNSFVRLAGNDFPDGPACLHKDASTAACVTTVADLNACGWPGCITAYANLDVPTGIQGGSDYMLAASSPLIDAGIDPSSLGFSFALDWDIDSDPRPAGGGYDIGADERQ